MEITGSTKICCVIGSPIQHSLSPPMHNSAFNALQLDYIYVAFKVSPSQLGEAVTGLKTLNIAGFNVTIPHKETIIKYIDILEPSAIEIGAVNTIIRKDDELIGTNTDCDGALYCLRDQGIDPSGMKITILGAGGAARAVGYAFSKYCDTLIFLNRTQKRAQMLSSEFKENGVRSKHFPLNKTGIAQSLEQTDMLVNATSVGMSPRIEESIIPPNLLKPELIVFDLVYNPIETRLLSDARENGLTVIDGAQMLVYQGAIAFEKWTGKKAPVNIMRNAVLNRLQKAIE